jgi:hypothetical protein
MPSTTMVKQSSWTSSISSFKIPGTNYPETHHYITKKKKKWSSLTLFTSRSSNLCHDILFPENCFYYHFHYCNEAPLSVSTAVCPLTKQNVTSHCCLSTDQTECDLPYTLCTTKSIKELSSNFQIHFNSLACWLWGCGIVTTHLKTITLLSVKARQTFTIPS